LCKVFVYPLWHIHNAYCTYSSSLGKPVCVIFVKITKQHYRNKIVLNCVHICIICPYELHVYYWSSDHVFAFYIDTHGHYNIHRNSCNKWCAIESKSHASRVGTFKSLHSLNHNSYIIPFSSKIVFNSKTTRNGSVQKTIHNGLLENS